MHICSLCRLSSSLKIHAYIVTINESIEIKGHRKNVLKKIFKKAKKATSNIVNACCGE